MDRNKRRKAHRQRTETPDGIGQARGEEERERWEVDKSRYRLERYDIIVEGGVSTRCGRQSVSPSVSHKQQNISGKLCVIVGGFGN